MRWRAALQSRHGDAVEPCGPWRRTYPAALADARARVAPHVRATHVIEDSRGRTREISETQHERGIEEYHATMDAEHARGGPFL